MQVGSHFLGFAHCLRQANGSDQLLPGTLATRRAVLGLAATGKEIGRYEAGMEPWRHRVVAAKGFVVEEPPLPGRPGFGEPVVPARNEDEHQPAHLFQREIDRRLVELSKAGREGPRGKPGGQQIIPDLKVSPGGDAAGDCKKRAGTLALAGAGPIKVRPRAQVLSGPGPLQGTGYQGVGEGRQRSGRIGISLGASGRLSRRRRSSRWHGGPARPS